MKKVHLDSFTVTGIWIKTSNSNGQATADIPRLWERFYSENVIEAIPEKETGDVYCVYTGYEGDFTQPYITLIGCRVPNGTAAPEGMKSVVIQEGDYMRLIANGKLSEGIVVNEWSKVWQSGMARTYQADFEVYDADTDPDHAEVGLYVGIP